MEAKFNEINTEAINMTTLQSENVIQRLISKTPETSQLYSLLNENLKLAFVHKNTITVEK